MTISMWVATIGWFVFCYGLSVRRNRYRHVRVMITGILIDVGLVIYLQVSREAMQRALSFTLGAMQQAHIVFSSLAMVLYIPVLILGWKLYSGRAEARTRERHVRMALAAFLCRTLGFLFMFSMWES